MRAVVVGASSGLGRCIALGLAQRGAQVALLARRQDRLEDLAKEIGEGALPIACDATDEASVRAAIEQAATAMGGIDGLVYAPGVGPLKKLVDVDSQTWHHAFDVNVVGAALTASAAMPHLEASSGSVAFLSSVSASQFAPWPGLGAYAVTKAALDKLVEAFNVEHPKVGFTRVVVGDCTGGEGDAGTEFANGWDQEVAAEVMPIWIQKQYIVGSLMEVDELVRVVDTVLRCGPSTRIPSVIAAPRPPS